MVAAMSDPGKSWSDLGAGRMLNEHVKNREQPAWTYILHELQCGQVWLSAEFQYKMS